MSTGLTERSIQRLFSLWGERMDSTAYRECAELQIAAVLADVQLVAYYTALRLDRSIDKPRNLAKSVTVE